MEPNFAVLLQQIAALEQSQKEEVAKLAIEVANHKSTESRLHEGRVVNFGRYIRVIDWFYSFW
jgi:P2-related tail formation protein